MLKTFRDKIPNFLINLFWHLPLAILASTAHGFPSRKLKVIGVTGSDGKTTTVTGIYHILKTDKKNVSMISTVKAVIGKENVDTGFHVTSPEPWMMQKLLKKIVNLKYRYLVLESTSHGLSQHRLFGIKFDIGVVTNITHEHLDYHGNYNNYLMAKAKLFSKVKLAVLNSDDKSYDDLLRYINKNNFKARIWSYGIENSLSDLVAVDIKIDEKGISFTCLNHLPNSKYPKKILVKSNLLGYFNVYNSLAMIAVSMGMGVDINVIQKALAKFPSIPGRMEITQQKGRTLVIDFAHTPFGLQAVLKSLRMQLPSGKRLIAVFGCAGLRDIQKRPMMGEVAAKFADLIILTAEDPRTEDVNEIINQIAKGCLKIEAKETSSLRFVLNRGSTFIRIPDRQKAIDAAVKFSQPGDIIGVFGKGHEQTMCFGVTEYPWSDRDALSKAVKLL